MVFPIIQYRMISSRWFYIRCCDVNTKKCLEYFSSGDTKYANGSLPKNFQFIPRIDRYVTAKNPTLAQANERHEQQTIFDCFVSLFTLHRQKNW